MALLVQQKFGFFRHLILEHVLKLNCGVQFTEVDS